MRKLLLLPLRLAVGWGMSPRLIGLIAATTLVLLRLAVGWHFYTEGVDKLESGNWSAAPFFANAKGPLAENYRQLVWDDDGSFRLNRDAMVYYMAQHRELAALHFGFDEQQRAQAQRNYSKAVEAYDWILAENAADLEEFKLGRERIAKLATGAGDEGLHEKKTRDGVASLGGQRETIRREWQAKGATAMAQIESLWQTYEADQNAVATPEQRRADGRFEFIKPRVHPLIDTSVIDRVMPYFDAAIGVCLLIGLFTPIAGLAAGGFLLSVFLGQLPPGTGPTSSNYQLVESMACLVLAATGAGRFAGLDYFLHLICRSVWSKDDVYV